MAELLTVEHHETAEMFTFGVSNKMDIQTLVRAIDVMLGSLHKKLKDSAVPDLTARFTNFVEPFANFIIDNKHGSDITLENVRVLVLQLRDRTDVIKAPPISEFYEEVTELISTLIDRQAKAQSQISETIPEHTYPKASRLSRQLARLRGSLHFKNRTE